jgi:DNA-binding beta-propeller fold protein YncE
MLTQIASGRVYNYSHCVGRGAQSGMGFNQPASAAVGQDDMIYVVNRGSESIGNVAWNRTGIGARISRVTIGTTPGDEEFIGEFSKYGSNDGEFIWGSGVAVDKAQNIYVTDEWLNQVSIFDKDGNFISRWSALESEDGKDHGIASIALDQSENVFVSDGRSHEIRKFSKEGKFITSWGKSGSGEGEFNGPWGITIDQSGSVYVADHQNHRVQKFTNDGKFVSQFGKEGTGRGSLTLPTSVAVDPDGDVYICDWTDNGYFPGKIQIFDKDGAFITSLEGDAQQLSKWAQLTVDANADYAKRRREVRTTENEWKFAVPTGVLFDTEKSRLIVVDSQRSRLQIYNKEKEYMVPQMNL